MIVLVFGGRGFLGMEVVKVLKEAKYSVFSASRNAKNDFRVDVSNYADFSKLPKDFFDVVINCATTLPGEDMFDNDYLNRIYQSNILGTQNICKWISYQSTVKKIINCSTLAVVNKPWDLMLTEKTEAYPSGEHVLYSSSKLMQELIVKTTGEKLNIDFVNIRFSAIYGKGMPKSGIVWALYQQGNNNDVIRIINGNKVSFDFIHVSDAARILLALTKSGPINGILNAASGVEITLLKLSNIVRNNISKSIIIENDDSEDMPLNRSKIDIQKLNCILSTDSFLTLDEGLKQVFELW